MKITKLEIQLTFTEPLLGSASNNRNIHEEFIAAKSETVTSIREEVEAIPPGEEFQKSMTVFPSDETGLHLWDYQVRGFFKESIGGLIELGDCDISKWQYKKAVDSFLFVGPRRIYLCKPDGTPWKRTESFPETLSRPLRADTMRGERVALATSEVLPVGTIAKFSVTALGNGKSGAKTKLAIIDDELIRKALAYGQLKGFGQWRSGGYGRFDWSECIQSKEKAA
jgi:hypothetical protein